MSRALTAVATVSSVPARRPCAGWSPCSAPASVVDCMTARVWQVSCGLRPSVSQAIAAGEQPTVVDQTSKTDVKIHFPDAE